MLFFFLATVFRRTINIKKDNNEIVAIKKFKDNAKNFIRRELKMLNSLKSCEFIINLKEAYKRKEKVYFIFEYVERVIKTNTLNRDDCFYFYYIQLIFSSLYSTCFNNIRKASRKTYAKHFYFSYVKPLRSVTVLKSSIEVTFSLWLLNLKYLFF